VAKFWNLEKGLIPEILKYAATAGLGAIAAFAVTVFNRLPSRALTVLPAGIHVLRGPILACKDQTFITGEVNEYLDTNIMTPPCDALLNRSQASELVAELNRARDVYINERQEPLKSALNQLRQVEQHPLADERVYRSHILQAVANLVYISRHAPSGVSNSDLLSVLKTDVSAALKNVNSELDHMGQISDGMQGKDPKALENHTELYFVVDNSSDIEFYMPTHCSLATDSQAFPLSLESIDNGEIPVSSLVYLPILPGRGKMLKYSLTIGGDQSATQPNLKSVRKAFLQCRISTGKIVNSPNFEPEDFTVRENAF
jgi:hypothetical protein